MPYDWTDPDLFITHQGVKIYHMYKGSPGNECIMDNWFTMDPLCSDVEDDDLMDVTFDVRDLPDAPYTPSSGWGADKLIVTRITNAIEHRLLKFPPGNEPEDPEAKQEDTRLAAVAAAVKALESKGVEPDSLDDIVHELKGDEGSAINNGGLYEQVEYILSSGVSLDELFGMLSGR